MKMAYIDKEKHSIKQPGAFISKSQYCTTCGRGITDAPRGGRNSRSYQSVTSGCLSPNCQVCINVDVVLPEQTGPVPISHLSHWV